MDYSNKATRRPEQAIAMIAAWALLASGVLHSVVWLMDGGSLEGPVSFRKPILFGFSGGVTLMSVGWLIGKLRRRVGDLCLVAGFSAAMVVEVGLITLQQWRGVPSHFNRATYFDAGVLLTIEVLIVFATLAIAELTRRSFGTVRASAEMRLAIRGGMSLLLFSCLVGFALVGYGHYRMAVNESPEIWGDAGAMKFPHGVPMHAIQLLPLLAWVLVKLGLSADRRYRATLLATAATCSFTLYSLAQTFSGRSRFDMAWLGGSVLMATTVVLLLAAMTQFTKRVTLPFAEVHRQPLDLLEK